MTADKLSGHFQVVALFYSEIGSHISIFLYPYPQLISDIDENAGENTREVIRKFRTKLSQQIIMQSGTLIIHII